MVDPGQVKNTTSASDFSLKKQELLSSAMKRTSEWYFFFNVLTYVIVCYLLLDFITETIEFYCLIIGFFLKRFLVMSMSKLEKLLFHYIR